MGITGELVRSVFSKSHGHGSGKRKWSSSVRLYLCGDEQSSILAADDSASVGNSTLTEAEFVSFRSNVATDKSTETRECSAAEEDTASEATVNQPLQEKSNLNEGISSKEKQNSTYKLFQQEDAALTIQSAFRNFMSFWIPARELSITWSEDPQYWNWVHHDSSRSEVAELIRSCWLEIIGKIDIRSLRVKTSYTAYLVFKLQESSQELQKATASVRFLKEITEGSADEGYGVFIDTRDCDEKRGRFPFRRSDGWMEIKLGEFFNNLGDDGEVEMRLIEKNNPNWKTGLIVRGIDIRPN